jgi:hypothetical protein
MTLISIEEAKTRLADCNVLLKYMAFLQKNGLSDCGKGQIIGQASLLQEYLKEEEQQENKQWDTDKPSHPQKEHQEKQQGIIKDADKVGRMMMAASTFHENAVAVNNSPKSDLLRQVGSVIDKAKHTVEQNKQRGTDGPIKQAGQILPEAISDATTEDDNKPQQIGGIGTNKEKNQSWINKIKKVTEVENWQSWQ